MIVEFTLCLLVFALFRFVLLNGRRPQNLPPGPFRWPMIGNVVEMALADVKYPHKALGLMAKKYGDVMGLGFGVHYMVVISSYEAMKDILSKPEVSMARLIWPFVPDRAYGKVNMGIIWNGFESWQELKRFTIRTLRDFGFGKTNSMTVVMQDEVKDLVTEIKSQISTDGVWDVDAWLLASSAINILWSLVAGYRFSLADAKLRRAVQLNDNIVHAVGFTNKYSIFPWVKDWFPKWSRHEEHLACYEEMQVFLKDIIDEIDAKRKARSNPDPESFIEVFLYEAEKRGGNDSNYNIEQLIVILQDLFLAGSETTSNTVNWLLLYVALNPEVQKRVQMEIAEVIGENNVPTLHHENSMPYTKATILETFRTAIILPMPGPRVATQDLTVGDYVIPKGTGVTYNLGPMLDDAAYWGDPEAFRPERFLRKDEKGEYQIVKAERITMFGFGRRICLGESLAWNSLFLYTTTLLQKFELSIIPGMEPSTEAKSSGTLTPESYRLRVKCREE